MYVWCVCRGETEAVLRVMESVDALADQHASVCDRILDLVSFVCFALNAD